MKCFYGYFWEKERISEHNNILMDFSESYIYKCRKKGNIIWHIAKIILSLSAIYIDKRKSLEYNIPSGNEFWIVGGKESEYHYCGKRKSRIYACPAFECRGTWDYGHWLGWRKNKRPFFGNGHLLRIGKWYQLPDPKRSRHWKSRPSDLRCKPGWSQSVKLPDREKSR